MKGCIKPLLSQVTLVVDLHLYIWTAQLLQALHSRIVFLGFYHTHEPRSLCLMLVSSFVGLQVASATSGQQDLWVIVCMVSVQVEEESTVTERCPD